MITTEQSIQLARYLASRRAEGLTARLPADASAIPVDDAYAVQWAGAQLQGDANPRTGYKVAVTAAAAQKAIGASAPAYASLFTDGNRSQAGTVVRHARYPTGVECELAIVMGADVQPGHDPRSKIDHVAIGCEIIEDRYEGTANAGLASLIADNFAQRGYLIGAPVPASDAHLDPENLRARVLRGDTLLASGRPGEGTANPLGALGWLQKTLERHGRSLAAGDVILTGSIAPPLWLDEAGTLTLTLEPLGELRVTIE